jgi:hypothetical protein
VGGVGRKQNGEFGVSNGDKQMSLSTNVDDRSRPCADLNRFEMDSGRAAKVDPPAGAMLTARFDQT